MNREQQATLRAHYLKCYREAQAAGFKYFAAAIYQHYISQWPDDVLDWPKLLGGVDSSSYAQCTTAKTTSKK